MNCSFEDSTVILSKAVCQTSDQILLTFISSIMNSNSITEGVDIRHAPITNETIDHPLLMYNMDTDEMIALCCMMTLFFILGVPGNTVSYYVIYKRRDKTPFRLLILALTAADLISCCCSHNTGY